MLEAFTTSSDSRLMIITLMFLTEKNRREHVYCRIWHSTFKRITSSYADMANSEKVFSRYISKTIDV